MLRHIKSQQQEKEETSTKKTLIGNDGSDDEGSPATNELVWLIMTTKKHAADKNRLKPGKISIPHSLNNSSSLNICLITADPQRSVKDVIADPAFPSTLSSRITRVIGVTKLRERYKSFESRRQLLSEHDVFLADDRIIMRLIQTLGKIFYKSSKRPIPIRIEQIDKVDGKRVKNVKNKQPKEERKANFASPLVVAKEIEKALDSAPVYLAPSTSTAVRVGTSGFAPDQLVENVQTVVNGLTEKFVTKGWRNVKAIHIKGPTTMALPIWLADELWLEETDVLEKTEEETKAEDSEKNGKKRKNQGDNDVPRESTKKTKKLKAPADDDNAFRKEKLQKRKAQVLEEGKA